MSVRKTSEMQNNAYSNVERFFKKCCFYTLHDCMRMFAICTDIIENITSNSMAILSKDINYSSTYFLAENVVQ